MKPSERFARHFLQPIPGGVNMPVRQFGEYRGEKVHPDVERRMREFRAIPSLYGERK